MQAGEPRVELDMPIIVVGKFGHMTLENGASVETLLANFFNAGNVVSLHIIAEYTGQERGFCNFEIRREPYPPHKCDKLLNANGVCPKQDEHAEQEQVESSPQLPLE